MINESLYLAERNGRIDRPRVIGAIDGQISEYPLKIAGREFCILLKKENILNSEHHARNNVRAYENRAAEVLKRAESFSRGDLSI